MLQARASSAGGFLALVRELGGELAEQLLRALAQPARHRHIDSEQGIPVTPAVDARHAYSLHREHGAGPCTGRELPAKRKLQDFPGRYSRVALSFQSPSEHE